MIYRGKLRSAIALIAVAAYANACTNQSLATGKPNELMRKGRVDSMTVRRIDGRKLVLLHPEVVRDTVWGTPSDAAGQAEIGIPASDIEWASAEVTSLNGGKTFLLVSGIVLAALVVAALVFISTWNMGCILCGVKGPPIGNAPALPAP